MIQKKIKSGLDWIEDHFRRMCGEITPDKRLAVVLTLLVIFSCLSLYVTVYSIYSIGKSAGERKSIEQVDEIEEVKRAEYFPFEIPEEETEPQQTEE